MSNFHFLKKDLEWKIVKTQCRGPRPTYPTTHKHFIFSLERHVQERTIYSWILTGCNADRNTHRPFVRPCPSLLYIRSREKISLSWEVQKWVTNRDMSDDYTCTLHHIHRILAPLIFSLEQQLKRENYTPTIIPLPGNSRNEWQIEIWVANHFKILCAYYTWSPSWTTYCHRMQNNPFGEKNNSTSSIALDDPSSILTKLLCIFAHTIIPTSFPILLLYNAHPDLSNTMKREKRILIWLLINYLIKLLTN